MTRSSQTEASNTRWRSTTGRSLVRVQVQAAKDDSGLIRALAERLRGEPEHAAALRSVLARALVDPTVETAFDVFGSDLPDEVFAGVFEQPRERGWSDVEL